MSGDGDRRITTAADNKRWGTHPLSNRFLCLSCVQWYCSNILLIYNTLFASDPLHLVRAQQTRIPDVPIEGRAKNKIARWPYEHHSLPKKVRLHSVWERVTNPRGYRPPVSISCDVALPYWRQVSWDKQIIEDPQRQMQCKNIQNDIRLSTRIRIQRHVSGPILSVLIGLSAGIIKLF